MNTAAIHTRLNEIAKSARIGASALAQDPTKRTQLDTSLAVILAHLQAIHAELKSPQADAPLVAKGTPFKAPRISSARAREPERDVNLLLSEVIVIIDALAHAGETALAMRFSQLRAGMQNGSDAS